jgi:hypothetical protein
VSLKLVEYFALSPGRGAKARSSIRRPGKGRTMLRVKPWFAQVAVPGTDPATGLRAQVDFITQFMGQLFDDLDAGRLPGARSAHFHRLGEVVRFRVLGEPANFDAVAADVERRLDGAQASGLIRGWTSEPTSEWKNADSRYGTDVPHVATPFTEFMEAVSRAATALLRSTGGTSVAEEVLWNWLHLVHNPMTGIDRHLVEVPGSSTHTL